MKPRSIVFAVLIVLAAVPSGAAGRRAVSLRVLQATLRSSRSQQAMEMCGITRVSGFLVDRKTRDIIIFGDVDPSLPPLQFDDFVVALRNIWFTYARQVGNTRYYSAPGCSIDPNPDTLRQLQTVSDKLDSAANPDARQKTLEEWKTVGRGPQKVRVMGVPFDSRFAKVMVDADFYMKRLVNGSVTLGIDGFQSLTEMSIANARQEMAAGKSVDLGQTLNRFWFCPGDTTFTDDDGAVVLQSCPVRLLTEQQFLTMSGVQGYGRPNPMAHRFAEAFTARYGDIEAQRPIYKELEGLFRLAALAKLIKTEGAANASGFDARYLLSAYPVQTVPVNRAVMGITDIREIQEDRPVADRQVRAFFWHLSCGGVSMDIRPRRIRSSKLKAQVVSHPSTSDLTRPSIKPVLTGVGTTTSTPHASGSAKTSTAVHTTKQQGGPATHRTSKVAKTPGLRKTVLSARKSSNSLYWDVPAVE